MPDDFSFGWDTKKLHIAQGFSFVVRRHYRAAALRKSAWHLPMWGVFNSLVFIKIRTTLLSKELMKREVYQCAISVAIYARLLG